jgi:hypothetical protein
MPWFNIPTGGTRAVELRTSGGQLQYRLEGDTSWVNLLSLEALTGPAGPTGATGPMPFTFRGTWDNFATYSVGDAVSLNGSLWWLPQTGGWTVGGAPPGYNWELLLASEKGDTGDQGPQGPQGTAGAGFSWVSVPSSATAAGTPGQAAQDASYVYLCYATNQWLAVARAAFPTSGGGGGGSGTATTVLLMHFDDTMNPWLDSSPAARTVTAGGYGMGVYVDGSAGLFGSGGAASFSGINDSYLSIASSADFDWSTGDAVIEGWIKLTSLSSTNFIVKGLSNKTQLLVTTDGRLKIEYADGTVLQSAAGAVTTGAWLHIAAVKSGSNSHLYVAGTRVATSSSPDGWSSGSAAIEIGMKDAGATAYIDEFRIRRNTDGGYTGATITVPTAAFTS